MGLVYLFFDDIWRLVRGAGGLLFLNRVCPIFAHVADLAVRCCDCLAVVSYGLVQRQRVLDAVMWITRERSRGPATIMQWCDRPTLAPFFFSLCSCSG